MDFMSPPMVAVDIIGTIVDVAISTSDLITTITDVVISGVNLFAGFARMIIQVVMMGMQAVSAIFNATAFALLITLFATTISILIATSQEFAEGIGNHIRCGAKEFKTGWDNTVKTLGIMADCSWDKFINFLNGNCTRYYIVDMLFGLLYGIFVQLPIVLIKAIFGIDLQFIVDFLYELILVPMDEMFYAISGFHLVKWSDSVIDECYRCKGKYTFATGREVYLYKTLNEWARLFDCSTEQIKNGFVKIFTSLIPSQKWGAWMNGQHKPGWDDEPGFW